MSDAFLTIAMPFDNARVAAVERYLDDNLGNPVKPAVGKKLDTIGIVHFMSIIVVPSDTSDEANLLLEVSTDDGDAATLRALCKALPSEIDGVLEAAGIRPGASVYEYLLGHALSLGQAWWTTLGLPIAGTVGLTAARIRKERDLAARIAGMLDELPRNLSALERLERVRNVIWNAGDAKWAFVPEPTPCLEDAPDSGLTPIVKPFFGEVIGNRPFNILRALRTTAKLAVSALVTMLWPVVGGYAVVLAALWYLAGLRATLIFLAVSALLLPAAIALAAALLYYALRRHEAVDESVDLEPSTELTTNVMQHETFSVQNLLFACSPLKPGAFRRLVLRFSMWSVGTVPLFCRPGFLGANGMIHFARWMVVPGTDKLLFLSNYDGTWEGYVGDFVQNAAGAHGVTSLWSCCRGFPPTRNLIVGANDRDRLVRWARRQQRPVHFWYTGYPTVTTDRFRTNAAIRQGLASAQTEQDAEDWLACFGSSPRPPESLQVDEIPALAFGGLGAYAHSARIAVTFAGNASSCCRWLADLEADIGWGETPSADSMLAIGVTASALLKIGIPQADMTTFPVAFQQGMADANRARALGDVGEQAPSTWEWGGPGGDAVDSLVLLYGRSPVALKAIVERVTETTKNCGHHAGATQWLEVLPPPGPLSREAFGFVDGVSQPRMRGTRRAQAAGTVDNDIIAPGELTLGYPDNLGRFPPTPSVAASVDPAHRLPDIGPDPYRQRPDFARSEVTGRRDIGRNGTYLVVRQLEQFPAKFEAWLDAATKSTANSPLPADPVLRKEMIAAKSVGRWRDGTSLLRYPDRPGSWADATGKPSKDVPPPDNEFMFGEEDPTGLRCPLGAHIRRANPRDGLVPGSRERRAVVNNHRILRVGRSYKADSENLGLLFMCVNVDIERQFEFVQESWLLNSNIAGLEGETDPFLGSGAPSRRLSLCTADGPLRLRGLVDFARMRGGGYFFLPGRAAYRFLADFC